MTATLAKNSDSMGTVGEDQANIPLPPAATRNRRGRRRTHSDAWRKVTVVLLEREIVFLDRLVADIRTANDAAISRAHIIRALIDALAESDIDLTASRSERDLATTLLERFRCRPTAKD